MGLNTGEDRDAFACGHVSAQSEGWAEFRFWGGVPGKSGKSAVRACGTTTARVASHKWIGRCGWPGKRFEEEKKHMNRTRAVGNVSCALTTVLAAGAAVGVARVAWAEPNPISYTRNADKEADWQRPHVDPVISVDPLFFRPLSQYGGGNAELVSPSKPVFTLVPATEDKKRHLMGRQQIDLQVISAALGPAINADVVSDFDLKFTLSEKAKVTMPVYLDFQTSFGGQKTYTTKVTGGAELFDAAGAVGGSKTELSRMGTGADFEMANGLKVYTALLNPGVYTIRTSLHIEATTAGVFNGAMIDRTQVKAQFGARNGLVSYITAEPMANPDSRGFSRATMARDVLDLDSDSIAKVKVAVFEPGLVYRSADGKNHQSFDEGQISYAIADPGYDAMSEHATAVASIIGSKNFATAAQEGIAPGVKIVSKATSGAAGFMDALDDLIDVKKVNVINMSASFAASNAADNGTTATLDKRLNTGDGRKVTMVVSSGNEGADRDAPNVVQPARAFSAIAVGNLDLLDESGRLIVSGSSSHNGSTLPNKPDIVAPGMYIEAATARGDDGSVNTRQFRRVFLGDKWSSASENLVETGAVSGTSFAAPHVAGAAALVHAQKEKVNDAAKFDARSIDNKVVKAVVLNGARTDIFDIDGFAWAQKTAGGLPTADAPGQTLAVQRSLDPQAGAGALDVNNTLRNYAMGEANLSDANDQLHHRIDMTDKAALRTGFWDLETARKRGTEVGTVDYLLGDVAGVHIRATLTWNPTLKENGTLSALSDLGLRLYQEGNNIAGYDNDPNPDKLIAATETLADENVKLFDFVIPTFRLTTIHKYYLQVVNNDGDFNVEYGLAVLVPTPASGLCLGVLGVAAIRRRRV